MGTSAWADYQEEAAAFFRGLGLDARTNVSIKGVRTKHDVDVEVRSHHAGFEIVWLVECKYWQHRVSKLHVLALREIVADIGADRGILLSEAGFQSGAVEAARLTNVQATSLASLKEDASAAICAVRLRELFDRIQVSRQRYWDIPKEDRIRRGLRPDVGGPGYSSVNVIGLGEEVLARGLRGTYPFVAESLESLVLLGGPRTFESAKDIIDVLEPMISELELRLLQN
jgi:restriction system protein